MNWICARGKMTTAIGKPTSYCRLREVLVADESVREQWMSHCVLAKRRVSAACLLGNYSIIRKKIRNLYQGQVEEEKRWMTRNFAND